MGGRGETHATRVPPGRARSHGARAVALDSARVNHDRPTRVIVPRWGGTATSDFYPRLVARASEELGLDTVGAPLAPEADAPEPAATARAVRAPSECGARATGGDGVIRAPRVRPHRRL